LVYDGWRDRDQFGENFGGDPTSFGWPDWINGGGPPPTHGSPDIPPGPSPSGSLSDLLHQLGL
jgi:hypothetical protein